MKNILLILALIIMVGCEDGKKDVTGNENIEGTITIKDKKISVEQGLKSKADLHVTADSETWIKFLAKEKNLLIALATRKIKIKGSPKLMKDFAGCFPS